MLMPTALHPASRTLMAFMDGELPIDERRAIAAHVADCDTCRDELDCMEADLDWFLVLEAASRPIPVPAPEESLGRVLAAGREWLQAHPEPAAPFDPHPGLEPRIAHALELLFGAGLASAIREHASHVTAAEAAPHSPASLLSAFLGRRAAEGLISDLERSVNMERSLART